MSPFHPERTPSAGTKRQLYPLAVLPVEQLGPALRLRVIRVFDLPPPGARAVVAALGSDARPGRSDEEVDFADAPFDL